MMKKINIIGAGLAGSECALQLADKNWKVYLYEMRPKKQTPAHKTDLFAELVCSNSLKSNLNSTSSGLLKAELDLLDCKLLNIARSVSVDAGNALAVDRDLFAQKVTQFINNHPNIEVFHDEVTELSKDLTVLATGPLTSDTLTGKLIEIIGNEHLYFFDAIAPVISKDSINNEIVFSKSRYDKGPSDYLNCPFTKDEYYRFVDALISGEKHEAKEFENQFFLDTQYKFYENCMPIEAIAMKGIDSLRFGVLRPVGLEDPRTGKRAFAVLQLRIENMGTTAYNLVGCQTMLKFGAQKEIFQLIPGLENAEFLRYGSIHRNTFLNTPKICNDDLSLKNLPNIYLAGQISGLEGYVESIYGGLLVSKILSENLKKLPSNTITGKLWDHLITETDKFLPMNSNFGILPELDKKYGKKERKEIYSNRSIEDLKIFLKGE